MNWEGFFQNKEVVLTAQETAEWGDDDSILLDKVFEIEPVTKVVIDTTGKIIGNVTGDGRIYHTPESEWYDKIIYDEDRGDKLFDTEEEAKMNWFEPME